MAAKIAVVTPEVPFVWEPEGIQRLWFFPEGSEYLRYSPHFHAIYDSGFRSNLPLTHMFVAVIDGKLSIKNYEGYTTARITVSDHVWYVRGTNRRRRAQWAYAMTIPDRWVYLRSGRARIGYSGHINRKGIDGR